MAKKTTYFVGVDEVGRGPIAGPVTICALVLSERQPQFCLKIKDSKQLTPKVRQAWYELAKTKRKQGELNYALASASERTIDRIGINPAIARCINRALEKLSLDKKNTVVLLDGGLRAPAIFAQETIIRGDEQEAAIALASIVAKVTRDRLMVHYGERFEGYGFENHKGYATREHREALKAKGLLPLHRKTFLTHLY